MPIETGIWKISKQNFAEKIDYSVINSERCLENVIQNNGEILGDEYLLLGRQVRTSYGKYIDLLAINRSGKISIIELKKDKTPREVVSQVLDYASWVKELSYEAVIEIFKSSFGEDRSFEKAFAEKFDDNIPDEINEEHDMLIVCTSLDNETERIINYLSKSYNVPINAVFFNFFKDGDSEYITRSWLIDPCIVENQARKTSSLNKSETWNGRDFVVNIDGSNGVYAWEDYRKYGFISASGGKRYISPLKNLFVGARIFAMIPKKGYLGVGEVLDMRENIKDFDVIDDGNTKKLIDFPLKASFLKYNLDNDDLCSYVVRVKWIKSLDEAQAYWEKGLKANQNTVFKLNSNFTIGQLEKHFQIES